MANNPTLEQLSVLNSKAKNLIVSASAGSGKTFIMIKFITNLITKSRVPVKRLLVLTFTKAAAGEMRERLLKALLQCEADEFLLEQIDDLSVSDISTIDAFCEKLLRRNLDMLEIDEGFKVTEEPSTLMQNSFEKALSELEEKFLNEIYYSFRKNKAEIFEVIIKLHGFFTAIKNGQEKLEYLINNQAQIYDNAACFLNERLLNDLHAFKENLKMLKQEFASQPKYQEFCDKLLQCLQVKLNDNFENNVNAIISIALPSVPRIAGADRDDALATLAKVARKEIKEYLDNYSKYNFKLSHKAKLGTLNVALLNLYQCFLKHYTAIKRSLDLLDFADIENYCLSLIAQPHILQTLQEKYDYIFVDEYQDTNRVQEAIIKPLTASGHFIAVGDPKQGIYGFRNATMEIMQEDTQNFSTQEDGQAIYLRGNFRSDNRLLSFVNTIFEKVMTLDTVNIDYANTSMLKGQLEYKKMALPSVRVDVVKPAQQEVLDSSTDIYRVKTAPLVVENKCELEAETIIARIDELLTQTIYDPKLENYRSVQPEDIVVLFRRRHALMYQLDERLKSRGMNVISDLKEVEAQDPEVKRLISLLKLLINRNDDISLCSVMFSHLGGFNADELATLKMSADKYKSFYEVLINSNNEKVVEFFKLLDELKNDFQFLGAYKALNKLFVDKNYFAYLRACNNASIDAVENFLKDIRLFDFNISEAVTFFTKVGGKKRSSGNQGNAIRLMTIHASKGLEYPIVILAGAGQSLEKVNNKNYAISQEFGIGTYLFDEKENIKYSSIVFDACNLLRRKKEMIDELMIFYVALTRAKNHLYIVGSGQLEKLASANVFAAKNYLGLINYAYDNKLMTRLNETGHLTIGDFEFNYISQVQELKLSFSDSISREASIDEKMQQRIKEYLSFEYANNNYCKYNIKNSVTSLNKYQPINYDNVFISTKGASVDVGNAYHEALKLIEFEKVWDNNSLEIELENSKINEEYKKLIDKKILLKNILKIKEILKTQKPYKEKQFLMKVKLKEIEECQLEDEVLVQGVIDLFSLGENNILIDYKFTQETNRKKILEKYKKQLDLYTMALEKGYKIKINKKYLLSLKNCELIEYLN